MSRTASYMKNKKNKLSIVQIRQHILLLRTENICFVDKMCFLK